MGASRQLAIVAAVAAIALVVSAGLNWAQQEAQDVNVQFHAFQDTRGVTVLSPTIDLDKDFTDRDTVRVRFGVDAITAASDSCARCHQEGANNSRMVINTTLQRKYGADGSIKVNYGGEYSQEKFYRATTLLTSVSRDLNKANTTVAGGFAFSFNQPMLHPSTQTELQLSSDAYAAVTQTLSKTTIAQVGYELNQISGFQTNPFLRTKVNGVMVLGNVPDSRTRHTFSIRLKQALPADTVVEADYRRYVDSWSVDSNAAEFGVSHRFTPQVLVGFSYRWYDQTGAYFYQPEYTGNPLYYTGDFRLVPFNSGLYSGRLVITPKGGILGAPDGTGLTLQYERYRTDNGFEAAVFTGGIRIPLK